MSAPLCVTYIGLRYEVSDPEMEALELRTDPRLHAARRAGLTWYWATLPGDPPRAFLLVGRSVAMVGPEHAETESCSRENLEDLFADTRLKLAAAGLHGSPLLYIQWVSDD